MFPEQVIISIILFAVQAIFAGFITVLVYRFYRAYHNQYFLYWIWGWVAFCVNMSGSAISLANVFLLDVWHPFRIATSIITVYAGILQGIWVLIGFYSFKFRRDGFSSINQALWIGGLLLATGLVFTGISDPDAGQLRIFLRLGIKELITGLTFLACTLLIFSSSVKKGRLKMALITFLSFAIIQLFYFSHHMWSWLDMEIPIDLPYYLGIIDFLLIVLIGIGMIMGVLEIERHKLKKANQQLDTFLYRSAHDLRTPIVDILGVLELIKLDETDNKDEYHELIRSQVLKADEVIKDIITLRQGQKHEVHKSKVDVQSVFEQIRSELVIRYPYAQKLRFEYVQDHGESVLTDASRLKAILSYLLSNAVQYHDYKKSDPFVTVVNEKIKSGYKLTISDNGSGIEENQQGRIFKMFHRGSASSRGSGLGLYIVKEAVEQLGGDVELRSKVEEGTSVEIMLHEN